MEQGQSALVVHGTERAFIIGEAMRTAMATYKTEVEQRRFPTMAHAPSMDADLLADL
jgi:ketopantoate hydroxymethyltransferase